MAENQKEKYLEEIEDQIRTIGVLTSGGEKRISRTFEGGDH